MFPYCVHTLHRGILKAQIAFRVRVAGNGRIAVIHAANGLCVPITQGKFGVRATHATLWMYHICHVISPFPNGYVISIISQDFIAPALFNGPGVQTPWNIMRVAKSVFAVLDRNCSARSAPSLRPCPCAPLVRTQTQYAAVSVLCTISSGVRLAVRPHRWTRTSHNGATSNTHDVQPPRFSPHHNHACITVTHQAHLLLIATILQLFRRLNQTPLLTNSSVTWQLYGGAEGGGRTWVIVPIPCRARGRGFGASSGGLCGL